MGMKHRERTEHNHTDIRTQIVTVTDDITTDLNAHKDDKGDPHEVTKTQVGLSNVENTKVKFDAITAPAVTDDSGDGYAVGSRWIDVTNDKEYTCLDSTVGAAVWTDVSIDVDWTNATENFKTSGTVEIGGTLIKTGAAWSKTIGSGGDYATFAAAMAAMPDLIAHGVTLTILKGTTLTETCNVRNKHGITTDAKIIIQSEKYFPTSGAIPTATGGSATTLADTGQAWAVNEFVDCWVFVVDGTGTNNGFVKITANSATTLTVASWTTTPDNTSKYLILGALVDGQASRNYCVIGSNSTCQIELEGIGFYDATTTAIRISYVSYMKIYYCGIYQTAYSGMSLVYSGRQDIVYCGIVGTNTNNHSFHGGINPIACQYTYIMGCGISDNNRQGIFMLMGTFGYINNNFGNANGIWGTYAQYSGQAKCAGTECSGSSGNHSNAAGDGSLAY